MLAATDWANLSVAGAFVLGAALATIAVLRVVRAVTVLFEDTARRRPGAARRRREAPPSPEEQGDAESEP